MKLLQELFDNNEAMSKIRASARKPSNPKDVQAFGMEDSDGNVIKVYVKKDQAERFDRALADELANATENDAKVSVEEVIFNLQKDFDIVDVDYPVSIEDEEPISAPADDADPSQQDTGETDMAVDAPQTSTESNPETMDMITSIVNVLIANAEANRQEALAKAAEAKAAEAKAAAEITNAKLRSEEEVADMEAYYDVKSEEQKEAKKLAKLAKFRHEMKKDKQDSELDDANDALQDLDNMDLAPDRNGVEDVPDMNTGIEGGSHEEPISQKPLDAELDDMGGVENEEEVDGPGTVDRRMKDLSSLVKYLHSLQVQKQAVND